MFQNSNWAAEMSLSFKVEKKKKFQDLNQSFTYPTFYGDLQRPAPLGWRVSTWRLWVRFTLDFINTEEYDMKYTKHPSVHFVGI